MNKFDTILLLLVCYSFFGFIKPQASDGFELIGTAKNVSDSTWIFLRTDKIINSDSCMVINEKFSFKGKVKRPTNSMLFFKSSQDYKYFWIENNLMKFEAEKGRFIEAKISGSLTQAENDILFSAIFPLRKEADSLRTLLESAPDSIEEVRINKQYSGLPQKEKEVTINFIEKYPGSLVSINALNSYKTTWGREKVTKLYDIISEEIKSSNEGRQIEKYIEINVNPKIGDSYVDFELPNVENKIVKLSGLKGKLILLDFWASWCAPCRWENKLLIKTYSDYHPKGFEILGVSGDSNRNNWLEAIKQDGLVWENVSDLNGSETIPFLIYGVYGIPDNFLIDENGKIIGRNLRGDDLRNKLKEILDKPF